MVDDDGGPATDDRAVRRTDEILTLLLAAERKGVGGRRLERLRTAEGDLRRCIVANAGRMLTDSELDLLALERQLDPIGAVERVASVGVVLLALPMLLGDPRWWGEDLEDRRLRIRLAETLVHALAVLPELADSGWACAIWDVEAAIEAARRELRSARGETATR